MIVKLKRWGNSLGLIVPAEAVRERKLQNGDSIEIEIRGKAQTLYDLVGSVRLHGSLDSLMRDVKAGWDDL